MGLGLVTLLLIAFQQMRGTFTRDPVSSSAENRRAAGSSVSTNSVSTPPTNGSGIVRPPSKSDQEPVITPSSAEPPTLASQLVESLAEIDVRPGALTPEKAAAWQQNMAELLNEGRAAVPALAEFFQKNIDVRFDAGPEKNLLGEPTLRIAFLKLLFDIPDPENVELQAQVLQTAVDPDEIVLIARQLELQEPGKHRDAIIGAAKRALENAESANRDTPPLLTLLKQYDEPATR
jgi:hypothetical protein